MDRGNAPLDGPVVASDAPTDAPTDVSADASRWAASRGTSVSGRTSSSSAIIFVWSLVVVWALYLSMGALDGSQVALFTGPTLGLSQNWGGGVRERLAAVVRGMEQATVGHRGVLPLAESERLCRCGGTLRLLMEYVEVMRADGSRLSSGFDPGWVEGRLAGPLGRGRAFGPASRTAARCPEWSRQPASPRASGCESSCVFWVALLSPRPVPTLRRCSAGIVQAAQRWCGRLHKGVADAQRYFLWDVRQRPHLPTAAALSRQVHCSV